MAGIPLEHDDRCTMNLICFTIKSMGLMSVPTALPNELFRLMTTEMVDTVLLDHQMSDTDRLIILRTIKAHPKLHYLPVMMLTAGKDPKILSDSFESGAFVFINKPLNEVKTKFGRKKYNKIF
ncbi:MAG: response regulator [Proteobacteria bacterium]|nr:response regulator [Pseudomonadota bacterium]